MTEKHATTRPDVTAAWAARAEELAAWAMTRLANRTDAWGAYRPAAEVGRGFTRPDGTTGTLGGQKTVKGRLMQPILARHFRARDRSAIVGLHTAGPDNLSKGGALDIDHHGPTSTAAAVNMAAALAWYGELMRGGFRPLLTESNGKGGYHLRVLLAEAIPADRLFHFLRRLTRDCQRLGFDKAPELFPKQPDVRRCRKGLGNWLRLPGRHHKRDFWSRVWDGDRWLGGHAAIDFILSLTGDAPDLVPDLTPPAPPPRRRQLHSGRRVRCLTMRAGPSVSAMVATYAAKLPHLGEGQGRDGVAFNFAAWLVRDMALGDDVALDWLCLWDQGNRPPKGRECLAEIMRNAHAYGRRPYGCGRDTEPAPAAGSPVVIPGNRPGHCTLRCRMEVY